MFANPKVFYSLIGVGAVCFVVGYTILNLNGESAICHENGYGDYNDSIGVCEVKGEYSSNLSIVFGNTANTPKPIINDKKTTTYNYLKNTIAKNKKGSIKIMSAATGNVVEIIEYALNESNDAEGFVKSVDDIIEEINQRISQAPFADGATYLEGISKAGRDVISAKSIMGQTDSSDDCAAVIVVGSGLSDRGVLNFADYDLLHKDVASVLNDMERAGELVNDLKGVKIIWSGIGQIVEPQKPLTTKEKENERNIYEQVLRKRGATSIVFDDAAKSGDSVENNAHTVKTTKSSAIVLGEKELIFKANQAELADEQSAGQALSEVFENANNNPTAEITITGYMASGNCRSESDTSLAGARANTVKEFLIKNGVKNHIESVNGGVFEPEKSECDSNGIWQSNLADYKRKVVIEF